MIPRIRTLSSTPQTHRPATLRAIAQKTDELTSRVTFLSTEAERMRAVLAQAPDDASSRLAWLNQRLHSMDV